MKQTFFRISNQLFVVMFLVDWLRPCPGKPTRAMCVVCNNKELGAHKKGLLIHAKSADHLKKAKEHGLISSLPKMTNYVKPTIDEKRKIAELKIAMFIAEHCSVNAVDHLGELISKLDPASSTMSHVKIHRTKCTGILQKKSIIMTVDFHTVSLFWKQIYAAIMELPIFV